MNGRTQFDLAILGGGCAGLALGHRLANDPLQHQRVIIVEPRETYQNDRTWSFWAPRNHTLDHLVSKTWDRWAYGQLHSAQRSHFTPHHPYQSIQSMDFYQWALDAITASESVELALGERVESVEPLERGWLVHTNQGAFKTSNIVDTRPPGQSQLKSAKMYQCFVGERLKKPGAFKPDQAELMTDMVADEHGFLFTYVLPLSTDEALVEATRFSKTPPPWDVLMADLRNIKARRGWLDGLVTDQEKARLPMGLLPLANPNPSWVHAGTAAGGLRAASGYGFMRIQRWAKLCHESLRHRKKPMAHGPEPRFQAWMDTLFLDVLLKEPARVPELFEALYAHAPVETLIRFMSDQSSVWDKLHIIRSLPAGPFLRTMFSR